MPTEVLEVELVGAATAAKQEALLAKLQAGVAAAVSGTVALDAATLAALEQVTALVSGTVALDAPTLAALEQITVTAAALPLPTGAATAAKQDTIKAAVDAVAAAIATAEVARNSDDDALRGLVATSAKQDAGTNALVTALAALDANRDADDDLLRAIVAQVRDRLPADFTAGRLRAALPASDVLLGSIQAIGETFTLDVTNYAVAGLHLITSATPGPAVAFEGSVDGVNWFSLPGVPVTTLTSFPAIRAATANENLALRFSVQGITGLRVRATSAGAAAMAVKASLSQLASDPAVIIPNAVNVVPAPTNGRLGAIARHGAWYAEAVVAAGLLAGGVTTGATRDVWITAAGGAATAAAPGIQAFRCSVRSDVAGILYVETSDDNVVWDRVASRASTQGDASMRFAAALTYEPDGRYYRVVYVNDGNAATFIRLRSALIA